MILVVVLALAVVIFEVHGGRQEAGIAALLILVVILALVLMVMVAAADRHRDRGALRPSRWFYFAAQRVQ